MFLCFFFFPATPFRFTDSLSLHIFNSSPLNVSPFFSFPLILPIRFTIFLFPLMFHRVFPSYTTHSFHRDSLSLHFNSSPLNVSPFFFSSTPFCFTDSLSLHFFFLFPYSFYHFSLSLLY